MKFRLLGQDVAISEAAESYNTYRKLFIGQAKTAANQFFDAYERNQSLEDVVRKTPDQIAACIAPSVELCIQILVDHGVYTIDREPFSSTYRSYLDRWKKAYEASMTALFLSRRSWISIVLRAGRIAAAGSAEASASAVH